ncbi:MAG: MoxR family ATPase [Lachnospiraceae bacterium]|nr:MoxR family ATPase [Lachnospiraceae bacterium]
MTNERGYELADKIMEAVNTVFVGKEDVVKKVVICMLAGGHILLEDVPGVGKTTLARTLGRVTGCSMGRIQFTPDTLPGDIVGMSVYNMKTGEFEYRDGVIMHQILLADEINRTSPKTQASLLEAMGEGQTTVNGTTYPLPKPFLVIATQNPVDFLGTYPLPEAQMDRFMMRLSVGYPGREQEIEMASLFLKGKTFDTVENVCSPEEILELMDAVSKVEVKENILAYIQDIVALTRKENSFHYGVSPRGMLALVRSAQAAAFLQKRDYVKPDDVKSVAGDVLAHRLILTSEARIAKADKATLLKSLILKAKIPV